MGLKSGFWRDRTVLLTGHTGFKGGWLSLWLTRLGARVSGFALDPPTRPSFFEQAGVGDALVDLRGDIRDLDRLSAALADCEPEVVIHLAAQSLVRESYRDPHTTFTTNVTGTVNILHAVSKSPTVRSLVVATSDKCYENPGDPGHAFVETDRLGGIDPYSASKACAELAASAWTVASTAEDLGIATARAGNVIGGGDYSADRLVPDVLRSRLSGTALRVRNPAAVRPWQHVLEPLQGYLLLAQRQYEAPREYAGAWNFGPPPGDHWPVHRVVAYLAARAGIDWTEDTGEHPHEAEFLSLDASKARAALGWRPVWSTEEALGRVWAWHEALERGDDMQAFTLRQIEDYAVSADSCE